MEEPVAESGAVAMPVSNQVGDRLPTVHRPPSTASTLSTAMSNGNLAHDLLRAERKPRDARVVVYGPDVGEDHRPRPAIRPYPTRYVRPWTLADGQAVTIRPIRPEDEPLMVAFHQSLSAQSVYFRYFQTLKLSQRGAH